MEYIKRIAPIIFWILIALTTFLILQACYKYHFYYIEQFQLFRYNKFFLSDLLFSVGGLSEIIALWLLQFYYHPYMGTLITCILVLTVMLLINHIIKKAGGSIPLIFLSLLTGISFIFLQLDHNYYTSGTISFIFVLLSFCLFIRLTNIQTQVIVSSLLAIVLFFIAGSGSFLFSASILIYGLQANRKRLYYFLIPLIISTVLAIISVHLAWIGELKFAFLPSSYYQSRLTPPLIIYLPSILLLITILLAYLLKKWVISNKVKYTLVIIQLAIVITTAYCLTPTYGEFSSLHYKKLDYYARNNKWDNIIEESKQPMNNLLYVYYLNLALTEKEELANRFLQFDQKGTKGLIFEWNKDITTTITSGDMYFALGNIAASQHIIFEGNILISKSGSPRFYQRLVQTNIIYGAYPVAEKYIRLLEQTQNYKEWAHSHRQFLYNDQAIEKDPILGSKRRALSKKNYLYMSSDIFNELDVLIESDSSNIKAKEYLGTLLLLDKRIDLFIQFINKHYDEDTSLSNVPKTFQEAIITAYENNSEEWVKYKIDPLLIRKFQSYKQTFLKNKNHPNLSKILRQNFGDTYWYYFMFS